MPYLSKRGPLVKKLTGLTFAVAGEDFHGKTTLGVFLNPSRDRNHDGYRYQDRYDYGRHYSLGLDT
jgi:hypothetical protein